MIFKSVDSIELIITTSGKICIRQDSNEDDSDTVFITLDQFELIGKYILENISNIELAWNDGVENE